MGKRYWPKHWAKGWYIVDNKTGEHIYGPVNSIITLENLIAWSDGYDNFVLCNDEREKWKVVYEPGMEEDYE